MQLRRLNAVNLPQERDDDLERCIYSPIKEKKHNVVSDEVIIPGQRYLLLMDQSSRKEANFLNGAPETCIFIAIRCSLQRESY